MQGSGEEQPDQDQRGSDADRRQGTVPETGTEGVLRIAVGGRTDQRGAHHPDRQHVAADVEVLDLATDPDGGMHPHRGGNQEERQNWKLQD
ncbi:MAG: hypothetical protein MUE46_06585, partial [Xanthomonadales bacterium]|nr:hypothetical protein [Xanthomonadales bacterium]